MKSSPQTGSSTDMLVQLPAVVHAARQQSGDTLLMQTVQSVISVSVSH